MQEKIPEKLKPLYMRAKRRGIIELDILLGYVADKYLVKMTKNQIKDFKILLSQEDTEIYKWVINKEAIPKELDNEIWAMVKSFNPNDKTIFQ